MRFSHLSTLFTATALLAAVAPSTASALPGGGIASPGPIASEDSPKPPPASTTTDKTPIARTAPAPKIKPLKKYVLGKRTLKVGSRGTDVQALQASLTRLGWNTTADGSYGNGTARNVKKFERQQKLRADGKLSPPDAKRLKLAVAKLPQASSPVESVGQGNIFYLGDQRQASFTFAARSAGTATVELVNVQTGEVVRTYAIPVGSAGEQQTVLWDGLTAAGAPAPEGSYLFRMGSTQTVATAASALTVSFDFRHFTFPVRGAFNFGSDDNSHFNAARAGHLHQGQDIFAQCLTPIAAVQGGQVVFSGYQSAAGNYIVIRGAFSGEDYVYMHMVEPSALEKGAGVSTGQTIGLVGETGNAEGCHLHFEIWSAPGWYNGGQAYDPFPLLTGWTSR